MRLPLLLRLAALLLVAAGPASAQIIIDPIPRPSPRPAQGVELRGVDVDGQIRDGVGEATVTLTLFNPQRRPAEARLLLPVPPEAAVQDLVLIADGQELRGEVLPKDEARRRYEEIVRRQIDPALMEYAGYGLIETSVFPVPPGGESRVVFRYAQVNPREDGRVEFAYPLGSARRHAVETLRIGLTLRGAVGAVYSPSHEVEIERRGDRTRVTFEADDVRLDRDFRLLYEPADEGPVSATVLSHWPEGADDGYFLLLAAPDVPEREAAPLPKSVVFVLDRSGSMAGRKLDQAKGAMEFVLNNLREGDRFNVVAYDDRVDAFRPELQRYTPDARRDALAFVDDVRAGGSTNISGALDEALGMIPDDDEPAYVLFLTDGLPTAGETAEAAIAAGADARNDGGARVFAFGVGYDVNARLLERLARVTGGTTEYVRPEDDLEAAVATFYGRMSAPVLADLDVQVGGTRINQAYPRDLPDLFAGTQLVVAGRYTRPGAVTVRLSGRANGQTETTTFRAGLAREGERTGHGFVEPLWATRRVADLLDQIDLHGQSDELVEELVALATEYGILTPYTSFLAEEDAVFASRADQVQMTGSALEVMEEVSGVSGVQQRAGRASMAAAAQAPAPEAELLDLATGERRRVETMQTVAGRAFYRRGDGWVDARLLDADPDDVQTVTQLSDDYFALARRLPPELLPFLAFEEDVTVRLDGAVYRIEAAERE